MKAILIFKLSLFIIVFGYSQGTQNEIIGDWKVDVNETLTIMENSIKMKFDTLRTEVKDRSIQSISKRIFQIKEDGQLIVKWSAKGIEKVSTGTWIYDGNETLKMTVENQVVEYKITIPKNDVLILSNLNSSGLFASLYLKRN